MSWGQGFGLPWDGEPLIEMAAPTSEVGSPPTTYDMTDEPDGPLPGLWETYILDTDAVGDVTVSPEPTPATYYRVFNGLGYWVYGRFPTVPGLGVPYQERGVAAGPSGVLVGRNASVAAIMETPTALLGDTDDEFFYEVTLGLRFVTEPYGFVGGRARARWAGGSWVDPIALEAVRSVGQDPAVISAAAFDPASDLTDLWRANSRSELRVTLRGAGMTVDLNGVAHTFASVPSDGPAKPVVMLRVYGRRGAFISPRPALAALQVQSLRDLDRLGPGPQIPGDVWMEAATLPTIQLPIQDLLDTEFLKRIGSRRFQATREFLADVGANSHRVLVREGEVLHARERFEGQALVPVTRDLAFQRGRGGR